jgi:hypothetical protein
VTRSELGAQPVWPLASSAKVGGHSDGNVVGQPSPVRFVGNTCHTNVGSQKAIVSQSYQGSSPYSQMAADPRGVQAAPKVGAVAGQLSSTAGQEISFPLRQPTATTATRNAQRYDPK